MNHKSGLELDHSCVTVTTVMQVDPAVQRTLKLNQVDTYNKKIWQQHIY